MKKQTSTSKHATVKIGDYTIPLIGIPENATTEKCDACGKSFHISEVSLDGEGKIVCKNCTTNK